MLIRPARRVRGTLRVPGDKSLSHRAALLAALAANGRTRITNFATSADCASTLACLQQLGVAVRRADTTIEIEGLGLELPRAPAAPLDCGNSGTTMRLLAGVLAGQQFTCALTGDESLRARPMRRIIEPLELMGARVESSAGRAPLGINGRRPLAPINYALPVASAQVKSCVLLAGLNADGRTAGVERTPTRDHTERLLRWFGVEVETQAVELKAQPRADAEMIEAPAREAPETISAETAQVVSVVGPQAQLAARDCV